MRSTILCLFFFCVFFSATAQNSLYYTESDALYRKGLDLLQKSDYAAAREVFDEYIAEGRDQLKKTDAEYYAAYSSLILFHRDGEKRLERFIQENPSHPKASVAYYELGDFYFKQNEYTKAIEYLKAADYSALTTEQKDAAQFELGYSYFTKRKFGEALPQFDALKRRNSKYQAAASYYAGYIHFEEGNYDEALTDLQRAGENESYASVIPGMVAAIYYKQERYDELIAYSDKVLSSGSRVNEGEFYLLTADAYLNKENYTRAAENYDQYTRKNSNPARPVRYRIGYASYRLDDFATAIDQFKRVAGEKDSIGAYASYYLGILYVKEGNKTYAQNAFNTARTSEITPELSEESTYQYAKVTYDLGQTLPAIEAMTDFQKLYPNSRHSDEMSDLLSAAYLNTKNYALAISRIEAYQGQLTANLKSIYQKAAFLQGAEYFNAEDYRKALQMFEKAGRYPTDAEYAAAAALWAGESYAILGDLNNAQRSYSQAISLSGDRGETALSAHYGLAYALYNQQKYSQALTHFRAYTRDRQVRYYGDAVLRLADCYYVEKEYANALQYYSQASQIRGAEQDYAHLQQAVVNGISGNTSEALRGYNTLLAEYPRSRYYDDAIYQQAQLNFENGQFQESIRGFSRLISEKPRSQFVPYAYLKRATAYYNLQQYDKSIDDYQSILNEFPTHPVAGEALLPLQEVLNVSGKSGDFSAYLAKYKAANPDKENIEALEFETAANFYYNLEYDKTISAFEEYVRNYPSNPKVPEAKYLMAEANYRLGNTGKAKNLYIALLEEEQLSQYNRILARLADIESANGDRNEALRRYRQLASSANNKKELYNAWEGLMTNHFATGAYDSSRYYARQILERAQVNVAAANKAHLFIGKSEYALGNNGEAISEFSTTRDNARDQHGAEAQFLIGEILYNQGQYQESVETLISLNSDFASYEEWIGKSYLLLADNYVAMGDNFQARGTLNSLIENFPDEAVKSEARQKLQEIETLESSEETEVIIESDSIDIID